MCNISLCVDECNSINIKWLLAGALRTALPKMTKTVAGRKWSCYDVHISSVYIWRCRVFLTADLTLLRCLHFPKSQFDIFNRSSFWCKLLQYLVDLFSDFSSCLILAFTVERCIAAYVPTHFKRVSVEGCNSKMMMTMIRQFIRHCVLLVVSKIIGYSSNKLM